MWNFIKEIIASPAGSFGSVAAILCLLFSLAWLIGKWTEKLKVVDKLEGVIDTIKTDLSEIKRTLRLFERKNNPFGEKRKAPSI